jgi:hypothetical protein
MEVKHIFHHKELDGFRIKYDLCIPEENGIIYTGTEVSNVEVNEHVLFQDKVNEFLDTYSETVEEIERLTCQADGLDYTLAVTSGLIAGVIDMIFVGEWDFKNAKAASYENINKKVLKFANKDRDEYKTFCEDALDGKGNQRKNPLDPERLETAIRYLEWKYPLPGDDTWNGKTNHVTPKSHHLDDFSHHPTLIGMICCIVSQFKHTATYVDRNGSKINIPIEIDENGMLEGKTPSSKIASGFLNWVINVIKNRKGHLYSDKAGTKDNPGGGMGIPGSLMSFLKELSSLPIFKDSDFSLKLYKAFTNGIGNGNSQLDLGAFNSLFAGADSRFDLRTEGAVKHELKRQAIPDAINEVILRCLYFIRHLYIEIKEKETVDLIVWKNVIPFRNRTIVRMTTISTGTMEVVDMADASIRAGKKSGGNMVVFASQFVLRINFVGIGRFAIACTTDVAMGGKRLRYEYALASADVAIVAEEEIKVIDEVCSIQQQTGDRLKELRNQVNDVYNLIK